jgi:hypothetical protein
VKDLTPKSDTKPSDKTSKLWQNGKQLQDLPGELQKNRVELDLEACLTNLLNQLQSKITKAEETETTPDTTISMMIPLLKETSETWTSTKSTNNSINSPSTKMKMMRNLMKKSLTTNQKMMMMMKSTNSTHKDKETQTEVLTNTKMHLTTSSTMSSQMSNELHSSKEYASSARRKDIFIAIVRQGRFLFTKEEQEIWDNDKPTTTTDPDLRTKAKEERPQCHGIQPRR